jgi:hypothetical protein
MTPMLAAIYAIMLCIYGGDMTRASRCELMGSPSAAHFYRTPEDCDRGLQYFRQAYNSPQIKLSCAVKDEPTWEPVN